MKPKSVGLLAFLVLFTLRSATATPQEPPLPLDPLTDREREAAARVAREDARVREALGAGRTRLIYVDFIAVKTPTDSSSTTEQPPHRRAEALFYRYDENIGVRALVDPERGAVLDVVRVNGNSVPINAQEVEEAARLSRADPRVIRLLGGRSSTFRVAKGPASVEDVRSNRIEGLRTIGVSPQDPCYQHRCVVMFFRANNRYELMNRVVVDLTSQTVQLREAEK